MRPAARILAASGYLRPTCRDTPLPMVAKRTACCAVAIRSNARGHPDRTIGDFRIADLWTEVDAYRFGDSDRAGGAGGGEYYADCCRHDCSHIYPCSANTYGCCCDRNDNRYLGPCQHEYIASSGANTGSYKRCHDSTHRGPSDADCGPTNIYDDSTNNHARSADHNANSSHRYPDPRACHCHVATRRGGRRRDDYGAVAG